MHCQLHARFILLQKFVEWCKKNAIINNVSYLRPAKGVTEEPYKFGGYFGVSSEILYNLAYKIGVGLEVGV